MGSKECFVYIETFSRIVCNTENTSSTFSSKYVHPHLAAVTLFQCPVEKNGGLAYDKPWITHSHLRCDAPFLLHLSPLWAKWEAPWSLSQRVSYLAGLWRWGEWGSWLICSVYLVFPRLASPTAHDRCFYAESFSQSFSFNYK